MTRCPRCAEIAPCTRCLAPHPAVSASRDWRGLLLGAAAMLIVLWFGS